MKADADSLCAQNILKRVEERSERECTALDAHKELELVSGLPRPVCPVNCSLLCTHLPAPGPSVCLWEMQVHFTICFYNPEKSLGLNSRAEVATAERHGFLLPLNG